MTMQDNSKQQTKIADEIIDNAVELPLENQELLLMMAKAMHYTHTCVLRQGAHSSSLTPKADT